MISARISLVPAGSIHTDPLVTVAHQAWHMLFLLTGIHSSLIQIVIKFNLKVTFSEPPLLTTSRSLPHSGSCHPELILPQR